MPAAIDVRDLTKIFRGGWWKADVLAVSNLSLCIEEGEAFGFIGANGAGKSTTIKMLTGVLKPTRGCLSLFGVDASDPVSRCHVGYVPENPVLYDYLTPIEILMMGVDLHDVSGVNRRSHCMGWLERFGIAHVANKRLRGFSKGMVQRTALAHALAIQPRLLILDEPLSGLDPLGRREVVDILDEYRREGGTVFFSSHVLHDVERIADRFGLIHRGRLVTIRSPQAVVADQAGRYVVRFRADTLPAGALEIRPGLYAQESVASELSGTINRIQTVGGVVQDILPAASLETVFFRTVGGESGNPAAER